MLSESPWYKRFRVLLSLSFLLMVAATLFAQSGLAVSTFQALGRGISFLSSPQLAAQDLSTAAHLAPPVNASKALIRISQLDPNQYSSRAEYDTWAYSACSTASMTEVFDAYGAHYRITDVLQVEANIGAITPQLGLTAPEGIQNTAAKFGFKTTWGNSWSLDSVISNANQGHPVIVSFPPARYDGGHLLVVIGGDDANVYLADTSLWNRHSLSHAQFMAWWGGFAAVVTPN